MDSSSQSHSTSSSSDDYEEQETNYWRKEKGYKRKYQFREKRNYQVAQLSVLMLLLNENFDIELVPKILRQTKITNRLLKIKSITKDNESVEVNELIKRRSVEKYQSDIKMGTSEKKAKRRVETFKVADLIHLFIDILELEGYFFESKYSTGVDGNWKIETIQTIWYNNKIVFNKEEIEMIGLKIHAYLMKQIEMDVFMFEKGKITYQKE